MTGWLIQFINGVSLGIEINFPDEYDPVGTFILDLLIVRFVIMWGMDESFFDKYSK